MAIFTQHFSLFFLLLTLISSFHIIQARETQYFFNKIPSNNNKNINNNNNNYVVETEQQPGADSSEGPWQQPTDIIPQQQQEPNFTPENESYGIQAQQESSSSEARFASRTPSLNQESEIGEIPNKRYLPKNYNPVSYVTVPENNNNNYEDSKFDSRFSAPADYYNRGNSYYGESNSNGYNHYRAGGNRVQQQGMSDTRFMENGKYFYDIKTEQYARHPLENAGIDVRSLRNQLDQININNNNFMNNNDEQFQDEDDMP